MYNFNIRQCRSRQSRHMVVDPCLKYECSLLSFPGGIFYGISQVQQAAYDNDAISSVFVQIRNKYDHLHNK